MANRVRPQTKEEVNLRIAICVASTLDGHEILPARIEAQKKLVKYLLFNATRRPDPDGTWKAICDASMVKSVFDRSVGEPPLYLQDSYWRDTVAMYNIFADATWKNMNGL